MDTNDESLIKCRQRGSITIDFNRYIDFYLVVFL